MSGTLRQLLKSYAIEHGFNCQPNNNQTPEEHCKVPGTAQLVLPLGTNDDDAESIPSDTS